MRYNVLDIAKYIIDYCTREGKPISNLQLQKILYYIQLNFIRALDYNAYNSTIQAWSYGPVIPEVYEYFNSYGSTKICNLYDSVRMMFNEEEQNIVDRVIDACTSITPWELVEKSHRIGGPWERVFNGEKVDIPNEYIREYANRR